MIHIFHDVFLGQYVLLGLGIFGLVTSTVYTGLVFRACVLFLKTECTACRVSGQCDPSVLPVSVLKPLHGAEPNLRANLESFFQQDYANYEVLFCARTSEDAGLQIAREVAARHPMIPTRFFTTGEPVHANAKVGSLEAMYRAAHHDILIVSDSDVWVDRQYLREVAAPFRVPYVGAVTCLYRGAVAGQGNSLWAYLEGVGMSIEMPAGVLVARMLEGMQFLLGPTMAVRRSCVKEIGGFESLGEYCSDDFLLGNWIAARGHEVVLSSHVVDHEILNMGFLASVKHQVRWMKSTRCSRPKGHFGTVLTFAMPFALLTCATLFWMGNARLALLALGWGLLSRVLVAGLIGGFVVKERHLARAMLLHPLRDLMGFGYWLASYTNNRILWRSEEYALLKDGKMQPVRGTGTTGKAQSEDHTHALTL